MSKLINDKFGNRVRTRACGILLENDTLLMVKHSGLGEMGHLWIPPGGGINFHETIESTVKREFKEETGIDIKVGEFLFINEFISTDLHAIELFFKVEKVGGDLIVGVDPELSYSSQIIKETKFITLEELRNEEPLGIHVRFRHLSSFDELFEQKGFFNSENIYLK